MVTMPAMMSSTCTKRLARIIMAGIVTIGLLGLALDALFRVLHRWWFPYLRGGHQCITFPEES